MNRWYPRAAMRAVFVAVVVLCGLAGRAAAEPRPVVALIPPAAEGRLALYGAPVASELGAALTAAGFEVVRVADVAAVPARAELVVDGRLIAGGDGVAIELRIRDPEHGRDVQRLAARTPTLSAIDGATRGLADDLVAALTAAVAARRAAARPPAPPPPPPTTTTTVAPPRPAPVDPRPIASLEVGGKLLHDRRGAPLDPAVLARPALVHLADALGYRVADGGSPSLAIHVELTWIAAGFEGDVPIGRGRARVQVRRGDQLVFDRLVRTDTVVGSRGDRVDTIVRQVAAQTVDIALPRIRERLVLTGRTP
ncbi:MAG: hypothetical protein R3B06_09470 [Kofleriaceae bacterium]